MSRILSEHTIPACDDEEDRVRWDRIADGAPNGRQHQPPTVSWRDDVSSDDFRRYIAESFGADAGGQQQPPETAPAPAQRV